MVIRFIKVMKRKDILTPVWDILKKDSKRKGFYYTSPTGQTYHYIVSSDGNTGLATYIGNNKITND